MKLNPIVKNILSILAVIIGSIVLWNIAFLLDYMLAQFLYGVFPPSITRANWFAPAEFAIFVAVMGLISWFILRSKLAVVGKAIYLTVPALLSLSVIGILFYRWPGVSYGLNGLIAVSVLALLLKQKKPWLYAFAVAFTAIAYFAVSTIGGRM